ncbi:MAG TPA: SpoIIE family protein phosphatase [Acidobacteriaceae bacterium]|nr:SpoIIE family protein phosphatase [Acidobacteriaceae bacterium]
MFTFPVYAWILYVVLQRARQRWPDAHLLAIPVALLLATAFYYQLIFTIRTFGHPGAARYYPILRGSFFADLKDFGEIFFLLAVVLILGNRFARTRREAERTASELEAARAVQRVLVPEALPSTPGLTIAAVYHPAEQVGGDFFQILPLSTGEVLIAIGDVAGKGLPAALTVSLILGTLRAIVGDASGPGTLMKRLNTALGGDGAIFATCMLLQFSMQTATVTIANAGHLPAYCNRCELEITTALPLGMSPDAIFPEESFSLCGGEHIVLMTDRVPEAMHARELFGFERAGALTHRCAAQIADVARAFGQMDDITVLSIDVQIGLQSIAGHHRALGDS